MESSISNLFGSLILVALLAALHLAVGVAVFYYYKFKRLKENSSADDQGSNFLNTASDSLITSAKLSSLGEMAASICHEVNNPLAIISGHTELITELSKEDELEPETLRNSMNMINNASERMGKIIRGLRTFARESSDHDGSSFDLKQTLEESFDLCKYRLPFHNIDLLTKIPDRKIESDCNPTQLQQVILNLLNNTVDALEGSKNKWVEVELQVTDNQVRLSVTDSGKGIPSEIEKKIMEPFFTTKETGRGTGLGLSVVQQFAEKHHGHFYVNNDCSNTCFVLEFPLIGASTAKAA